MIPCGSDLVREDLMAAAGLAIRGDLSAADLRALARRERSRTAAVRMYAVANALEGMTRAEAARLAGGWSAKRCAMRWCATTPRAWQAFRTALDLGHSRAWTRPNGPPWPR